MDRLLIDEEQAAVTVIKGDPSWGFRTTRVFKGEERDEAIKAAQDAKSIRVDRQAMAEWLSQQCDVETHSRYGSRRVICPLCLANVILSGGVGKAPWEAM
ncbi:hypothetical protein LCGC14_0741100 [marine sediment metagenome]|uniref:Uncharacterized protein n=1 Tax=marine sediment metagenome TaxID=412755 RepID=A0A0F9Q6Q5_9ZZZZ